jgi:hypothetical protein
MRRGPQLRRNATGVGDDIGGEQLLERCELSRPRSGVEGVEQSLLLAGADRPATFGGETAAGTRDELPGVRLVQREELRDLPVRVIERLSKHIGGPFGGTQALQEHPDRGFERFASLDVGRGIGFGVGRFEAPRADLRLASGTGGLDDVDRESRRRRGEEASASRTSPRSVPCQRIQVSCTTSSASLALPSTR